MTHTSNLTKFKSIYPQEVNIIAMYHLLMSKITSRRSWKPIDKKSYSIERAPADTGENFAQKIDNNGKMVGKGEI